MAGLASTLRSLLVVIAWGSPGLSSSSQTCSFVLSETRAEDELTRLVAFAGVYDKAGHLQRQVFAELESMPGGDLHPSISSSVAVNFSWNPKEFSKGCELLAFAGAPPSYDWQGVIGNNGVNEGFYVWQGLNAVEDMAIMGSRAVLVEGYAELNYAMKMVNMSDTTGQVPIMHSDYHRYFTLTATDDNTAYFANAGLLTDPSSFFYIPTTFIVGYDYATGCDHNFTAGGRAECELGTGQGNCTPTWDGCHSGNSYWSSVIDYSHTPNQTNADGTAFPDSATGLAVQLTGRILAVAHGWRTTDNIRLFDKVTGASLCNFTLDSPRSLAFSPSGDLWAVSASGIGRYTIPPCSDRASDTAAMHSLVMLGPAEVASPGAIATGSTTDRLFVLDLASSQVRVFNGTTGKLLLVFGRAGGYSDGNITVGFDKFWLLPTHRGGFIAVDSDEREGLWLNDFGNRRILHIDSTTGGAIAPQIAYVGVSYKSVVHPMYPSRFFINFLEFEVDYTDTITPQSWQLVRNWAAGLPPQYSPLNYDQSGGDGFAWSGIQMIGFAHNTTLALLNYYPFAPVNSSGRLWQGVALEDNTIAVLQNWSVGGGGPDDCWRGPVGSFSLEADGSLRYAKTFVDLDANAAWVNIYESPFVLNVSGSGRRGWELSCAPGGFVGAIIASYNVSVNTTAAFMPRAGGVAMHLPITSSGAIILMDSTTSRNAGAHLGAVQRGAFSEGLLWTASPWGNWTLNETFALVHGHNLSLWDVGPQDGSYGAANPGTNYAAGFPVTAGRDLIFPFFGEGWMGWEANQFLHFTDTGLFVGQFGQANFPTDGAGTALHYVLPGAAGNAFSPALFVDPASGHTIFTHNDENQHGGAHVWKVRGGNLGAALPLQKLRQVSCIEH